MTSDTPEGQASSVSAARRRSSRDLILFYLPGALLVAVVMSSPAIGWRPALTLAGFTYVTATIAVLLGRSDWRTRLWQVVVLVVGTAASFQMFATATGGPGGLLSARQLAALALLTLCLGPLGGALLSGYEAHWRQGGPTRDYRLAVRQLGIQPFLDANCRLVHGPEPDPGHDEDDAMRALWEPADPRVWGPIRLLDVRDGTRQSDGPNAGLYDRLLIAVPAGIATCEAAQRWTYGPKLASGYNPARRT